MSAPIPPWGIYWISENCPDVEPVPYPTWGRYKTILEEGVDILGISFYTHHIPAVLKMIEMARKAGVKEIWGGNYGAATPGIEEKFDRIFMGNAEREVHQTLYGKPPDRIKHPILVKDRAINFRLGGLLRPVGRLIGRGRKKVMGIMWSKRGCNHTCSFCASPSFIGDTKFELPMDEIRAVLDAYSNEGIRLVKIMDLTFFDQPARAEEVIRELENRNMLWMCMTRVDWVLGRIRELKERGAYIFLIGIESLNSSSLHSVNKRTSRDMILELFEEIDANDFPIIATTMLGHEEDTVESLVKDIDYLASRALGLYQWQVVTPLPGSAMFHEYESRIIDWNWGHWNGNHLVFKHPHITPEEMGKLRVYAQKKTSMFTMLARLLKKQPSHQKRVHRPSLAISGKTETIANPAPASRSTVME
jgi:radical SAM superfamily enzyme YgiQ (UPF0313 family)